MNITTITKALQEQLQYNQDVAGFLSGQSVGRDEPINEDPNRVPWVCVYKGGIKYDPRTLGYNSFEADIELRVLVQATSLKSGEDCSELIDDYVQKIVAAIRADKTIGGTVDIVTNLSVDFSYTETDRSTLFFQMAEITINATLDDQI